MDLKNSEKHENGNGKKDEKGNTEKDDKMAKNTKTERPKKTTKWQKTMKTEMPKNTKKMVKKNILKRQSLQPFTKKISEAQIGEKWRKLAKSRPKAAIPAHEPIS